MEFRVRNAYNFELLCLLNVLTGDPFYTERHPEIYARFAPALDDEAQRGIEQAVALNESAMLSPALCLVISTVPNFERRSLMRLLADEELLHSYMQRSPYYQPEAWQSRTPLLAMLLPAVQAVEAAGFREYWCRERRPLIRRAQRELEAFAGRHELGAAIGAMLGPGARFDRITVYLCTLAAPHGIKVDGPNFISDVSFGCQTTLGIAVHEMFHPPYDAGQLADELAALAEDPLIKHAFETKDPRYGYPTMDGFLEENVVEAMAISICHRLGLESDPLAYFARHDDGSHVFSVILFDYLQRHPKPAGQPFGDYIRQAVAALPVGSLQAEFERITAAR